MAIHSSILAWEISWTEEPGGLQSMGSQRVRHDLATKQQPQHNNNLFSFWLFFIDFGNFHFPQKFLIYFFIYTVSDSSVLVLSEN